MDRSDMTTMTRKKAPQIYYAWAQRKDTGQWWWRCNCRDCLACATRTWFGPYRTAREAKRAAVDAVNTIEDLIRTDVVCINLTKR